MYKNLSRATFVMMMISAASCAKTAGVERKRVNRREAANAVIGTVNAASVADTINLQNVLAKMSNEGLTAQEAKAVQEFITSIELKKEGVTREVLSKIMAIKEALQAANDGSSSNKSVLKASLLGLYEAVNKEMKGAAKAAKETEAGAELYESIVLKEEAARKAAVEIKIRGVQAGALSGKKTKALKNFLSEVAANESPFKSESKKLAQLALNYDPDNLSPQSGMQDAMEQDPAKTALEVYTTAYNEICRKEGLAELGTKLPGELVKEKIASLVSAVHEANYGISDRKGEVTNNLRDCLREVSSILASADESDDLSFAQGALQGDVLSKSATPMQILDAFKALLSEFSITCQIKDLEGAAVVAESLEDALALLVPKYRNAKTILKENQLDERQAWSNDDYTECFNNLKVVKSLKDTLVHLIKDGAFSGLEGSKEYDALVESVNAVPSKYSRNAKRPQDKYGNALKDLRALLGSLRLFLISRGPSIYQSMK